jgi:phage/plasmid-associated DNA primase
MFMLTFICNKLPKLKFSDKATWNRFRVLCFESTFVEPGQPCPETLEEQMAQKRFPMDKNFKDKVPGMVTAFAWYLLDWRKKSTGICREPEKVKEATAVYRKQNDLYRQFIEERIVEDDCFLPLSELYSEFKDWFKEGFPNMTLPIKNEVKEYFEKCWGDSQNGLRWKGYRIRVQKDDIANGNAVILTQDDLVDYGGNNNSPV